MTGKSTRGREATGRKLNARIPLSSNAAASSEVPIGRRINGAEMLMTKNRGLIARRIPRNSLMRNLIADVVLGKSLRQPVKPQINHRSHIQSQQLAQQQCAHIRDAQGSP